MNPGTTSRLSIQLTCLLDAGVVLVAGAIVIEYHDFLSDFDFRELDRGTSRHGACWGFGVACRPVHIRKLLTPLRVETNRIGLVHFKIMSRRCGKPYSRARFSFHYGASEYPSKLVPSEQGVKECLGVIV